MEDIRSDSELKMEGYNQSIEEIRDREYPMLKDTIYLDHGGTAIPSRSLMERFSSDMIQNLYANPHSTSFASQATSKKIEAIRLRLLHFLNTNPEEFDVVFVANATAGIKLVADAFRGAENGFWFGYHYNSHTSIVGVRELAQEHRCFESDDEVEKWVVENCAVQCPDLMPKLFAYPAQSNMNGRRLPLEWCLDISETSCRRYTLLDAAALASTAPLDLSDSNAAADFTVLSLYKIFGFPDLGALIVKKASAKIFKKRRYFGGGTVDMVTCNKYPWHERRSETLHEQLEDGTLPIHNILALDAAFDTHLNLFASMERVSRHCAALAQRLYNNLSDLRHWNGLPVCEFYQDGQDDFLNDRRQGPVLAFNLRDSEADWVSIQEIEKLATIKNIQIRTGGLCNPGGVATALMLTPEVMRKNYQAGQRCGTDFDEMHNQPIGMVRVSIGPENVWDDILAFSNFVTEFFVDQNPLPSTDTAPPLCLEEDSTAPYYVESLMVYPIKSCAGWTVPPQKQWQVRKEGLAWDREWCIILSGNGAVMSQKRYPRMALIRPSIDLEEGLLRVTYSDLSTQVAPITIPLYLDPDLSLMACDRTQRDARACGDDIATQIYESQEITEFFTKAVGVPCQLGRFPPGGSLASLRHAKPHLQGYRRKIAAGDDIDHAPAQNPILLSNESPILTISRSSLNRLNEQIKSNGGKTVRADAFRANIIVAQNNGRKFGSEEAYAEDHWRIMRIGNQLFEMLGPCRRCQMVCIDQDTGKRNPEPFITLAKTRRIAGKVFFGQHTSHISSFGLSVEEAQYPKIRIGDAVTPMF